MNTELITHQSWNRWLAPLTDAAPCGPDLEYDPQFREFEEAIEGRPEAEYGATLVAAVPPDWTVVDSLGTALMERTRDLRVIVPLVRARLARQGVEGLSDGLALTVALLEQQWQHVHPQLDAGDADDPTARVNALAACVDPAGLLAELADTPLSGQGQPVTLREWAYASGDAHAPDGRAVRTASEIEAAIAATPETSLRAKAAFDAAAAHVEAIEALLSARVDAARTLDLAPLKTLLERARALFAGCLGNRADAPVPGEGVSMAAGAGDVINSRADVAATLTRLCEYYARQEPASPVPLLLGRAITLIDKSFVDLMKDLAPEGLAQLIQVVGVSAVESLDD
ncbi:type VI secretion system protein TssA [Caballeronia sp. SL2Y3]|uniref:type VI secretion system protein TssA n=1 Tax=Caballeronia sp. SL2Y3 TaxID=2878151 RepID=UPI001FD50F83|nr:type VI secretion system protein TssA [Caballeronia sp. SL2Y3]